VGYDGVVTFGNRLVDAFTNPAFNRNLSAHSKALYHDDWYTANPFKYIKEAACHR
jgi:hypothetical protein